MRNVLRGIAAPFRAIRLIATNARLRRLAVMPAVVNTALFLVGVPLAMWLAVGLVGDAVNSTGLGGVLLGFVRILAQVAVIALTVILSVFLFLIVGNIIASPFNSKLSEAAEGILAGREHNSDTTVIQDVGRSIIMAVGRLALFIICYPPILATGLIPVAGAIIQPVLSVLYASFVLSVDFSDFAFERHIPRFAGKLSFVWQRKALYLGFGLTAVAMAMVPIVNFLLLPVAVVGATILYAEESAPRHTP